MPFGAAGKLKFHKMHGLGNDFVVLDGRDEALTDEYLQKITPLLTDRNRGVGADGTIAVRVLGDSPADLEMYYLNADGSYAEMCGNGIRCVGKYAYEQGLVDAEELTVATGAGNKHLELTVKDGEVTTIGVDMGVPKLAPAEIPVTGFDGLDEVIDEELDYAAGTERVTLVNMGNPHCVLFPEELKTDEIHSLGPELETSERFPENTNVEFVRKKNPQAIRMRVWERGVGETEACGTGACGAAVAAELNGVAHTPMTVELNGGDLRIEWQGRGEPVFMHGPATEVFTGEIDIGKLIRAG